MEKISVKAPAKINLYLQVLAKRNDGFHEIESLIQAIDLCDEITLEKADSISLHCSDPSLPSDKNNLAYRAADAMRGRFNIPGVKIDLVKHIPAGAGLGGGSSDAAFVLRGLCRLFDLHPAYDELLEIAASLGSDISFFLTDGQALATGRGEILRPVSLPLDYEVAVLSPSISISTAEIYKLAKINLTKRNIAHLFNTGIDFSGLVRLAVDFRNDLEEVALIKYPDLIHLKQSLLGSGALVSSMTGSGSSFFGLFKQGAGKTGKLDSLSEHGVKVFWCKPILLTPLGR